MIVPDAASRSSDDGKHAQEPCTNITTILAGLAHLAECQHYDMTFNVTILESRWSYESSILAACVVEYLGGSSMRPHLNIKAAPDPHVSLLISKNSIILQTADCITSTRNCRQLD